VPSWRPRWGSLSCCQSSDGFSLAASAFNRPSHEGCCWSRRARVAPWRTSILILARANVALSVTLTTVSCLAAVLTTPPALTALQAQDGQPTSFPVPFGVLAGQLFLLLVLPVLAGMCIRWRWPDITKRHGRRLLGSSIVALAALLRFVICRKRTSSPAP
jgi:Sodium Bile acid symporter family